jgi:myosin heavy subunit
LAAELDLETCSFDYLTHENEVMSRDMDETKALLKAVRTAGFSDSLQADCWRVVAALLHLGNVKFEEHPNKPDNSVVTAASKATSVTKAAELLGVSSEALETRLTTRTLRVGVSEIVTPVSVRDAPQNRDDIVKNLFDEFRFVVLLFCFAFKQFFSCVGVNAQSTT